jgi:hypothetical protein
VKTHPTWPNKALRRLAVLWLACAACSSWAVTAATPASALLAEHARLAPALHNNAYGQPLVLQSTETAQVLAGEIYAVVPYPFSELSTEMRSPAHWCDIMILHINTKYCRPVADAQGSHLLVHIGKKTPQAVADASRLVFRYSETSTLKNYFAITLDARDGPLGTSNYRMRLEAVSLPGQQSFLHLSYSYEVGFSGRLAMQTYLATLGADKVGFTPLDADGQAGFVAGVRGVAERNTMRYYLAIDSFLASRREAPENQLEHRLQSWFNAVERYPRQLHEVVRSDYLTMKRAEVQRQQTGDPAAP